MKKPPNATNSSIDKSVDNDFSRNGLMLNNVIDDFPSPHFRSQNSKRYMLSSSENESALDGTYRNTNHKPDTLARSIKKQLQSNPEYMEIIKKEVREQMSPRDLGADELFDRDQ